MAELATIARPYAEALFKAAQGRPERHGRAGWTPLAAVAGNPQLLQFADNPKVTHQQVFDVSPDVAKAAAAGPPRSTSCAR